MNATRRLTPIDSTRPGEVNLADFLLSKCAAECNALRRIKDAGLESDTIDRDLAWADEDYDTVKEAYISLCQKHGIPACGTYNAD